jgi:O-antigen/teichoic acid export membrane protein
MSFAKNVAANLAGKAWSAVLMFLLPPVYVKLLGIESYGIIGLYASIVAVLGVLDLGLSTTLNREMARLSLEGRDTGTIHETLRTFEIVFWIVGIAAGTMVALLAPFIGNRWLHSQQMSSTEVVRAIRLIGAVFALQWPLGLYSGALAGLQRQVEANVVLVIFVALRLVGAAGALLVVRPSIDVFFMWQGLAFGLQTVATRVLIARVLPRPDRAVVARLAVIRPQLRFSVGVSVVGVLAIILTQADKLIVSSLVPLSVFGYYALSWTVGTALYALITPVFVAVFPRLTQLVKLREEKELVELYHTAAQAMAVLVIPTAAVVALFSRELVLAWTGDPSVAERTRVVVAIVTAGTALNGLMNIPYALQLAHGWTRLAVWTNLVGVIIIVPIEYFMTRAWGVAGAALGWCVLNLGYVVINVQVMHRRLLRTQMCEWYVRDNALPLLAAFLVILPLRLGVPSMHGRARTGVWLTVAEVMAVLAACLVATRVRSAIGTTWRRVVGIT